MASTPNRTMGFYKSYSFKDKDPVIDQLRTLQQDAGLTYKQLSDYSGVSVGTFRNWFNG